MICYGKAELYEKVATIKQNIGLEKDSYGIDLIELIKNQNVVVESLEFKTKGLRGMAIIGNDYDKDIIFLNKKRSAKEQNYDCGHEFIHLSIHREEEHKTFNCYETAIPNQNSYLEWHANEGAAELFIPYKIFIPMVANMIGYDSDYISIDYAKKELANIFCVPETVIKFRLENLKYELHQYYNGVDISNIRILSTNQQLRKKINIISLNEVSDNSFYKYMDSFYSFA